MQEDKTTLFVWYEILSRSFFVQNWWGVLSTWEYIIGAVLTQGTTWLNAKKALVALRELGVSRDPSMLLGMPLEELRTCIASAGFATRKSRSLRELFSFLSEHYFCEEYFRSTDLLALRSQLLGCHGVGMETADTILLYAFEHPVFVIDAYTKRLVERSGCFSSQKIAYMALQALFMKAIPHDVSIYKAYHTYIVELCKAYCCKRRPLCSKCPLLQCCKQNGIDTWM